MVNAHRGNDQCYREARIKDIDIDEAKIKDIDIDKAKIKDIDIDESKIKDIDTDESQIKDIDNDRARNKDIEIDKAKIKDINTVRTTFNEIRMKDYDPHAGELTNHSVNSSADILDRLDLTDPDHFKFDKTLSSFDSDQGLWGFSAADEIAIIRTSIKGLSHKLVNVSY